MNIILDLFLTFFKIGAFTFGGGMAMLPFIEREVVEKKKWITASIFLTVVLVMSIPMQQDIFVLISLYEALTASVIFLLTPTKAERFITTFLAESQPSEAVISARRLTGLSARA